MRRDNTAHAAACERVDNYHRTAVQPRLRREYNLLGASIGLAAALIPDVEALRGLENESMQLAELLVDLFVEAVQGPCMPNQQRLAESEAPAVSKRVLLYAQRNAAGAAAHRGPGRVRELDHELAF